MASLKDNFFFGMVTGVGGYGLRIALNLLLIPLFIHYIGTADYGFYLLLLNASELMLALDMGLTTGLVHQLSTHLGSGDRPRLIAHLNNGNRLYLGLSAVIFLIGTLLLPVVIPVFHLSPSHLAVAGPAFMIVVLDAALTLYGSYFDAVLRAHCMHAWTHTLTALHGILANAGSVVLLMSGFGLLEVLLLRLGISILKSLILAWLAYRYEPSMGQRPEPGHTESMRTLFDISMYAMVQRVSGFLAHRSDGFVIAIFLTMPQLALFGIIERIMLQISQLAMMLMGGLFPVFARIVAEDNLEKARFVFLRVTAFLNIVGGGLVLLVLGAYPEIFGVLSNGKFAVAESLPLAVIMGVVMWSLVVQLAASRYLFASGMHRFQTFSALTTALVNLGLSLWLIHPLGLLGVTLGTLIPHLLQHQGVTLWITCRRLKLPIRDYLRAVHVNNVPALLWVLACMIAQRMILYTQATLPTFGVLVGMSALASVGAGYLWYRFTATAYERDLLHEQAAKLRARMGMRAQSTESTSPAPNTEGL